MADGPPLTRISLRSPPEEEAAGFPFSVPALRGWDRLELSSPVTLFAGENGSGKSTLLESIAIAARLPTVGSVPAHRDDTLAEQRRLAHCLVLSWRRRTHRGFFMRAEDFFGFSRTLRSTRREMEEHIGRVDRDMAGASDYARGLAKGPAAGSLADMERRYGRDLDESSHGESFLRLLRSRLVPEGVFLLDEPEAALSPQSQLGLITMMKDVVDAGGQFLLATHSPLLLAIPGATILSFDDAPFRAVAYEDLEAVRLTRDFLQNPTAYLRHLWA